MKLEKNVDEYFVMLNTQGGSFTPMMDDDEIAIYTDKQKARREASKNLLGEHFGFEVFTRGTGDETPHMRQTEAQARDAERYRFIRRQGNYDWDLPHIAVDHYSAMGKRTTQVYCEEEADAVIDAAIAKQKGE